MPCGSKGGALGARAFIGLAGLLIGSFTWATTAAADEAASTFDEDAVAEIQAEYDGMSGEEIVEDGLAEEGFVVEEAEVAVDGIVVAAESEDAQDDFAFELALEAGAAIGTLTVWDEVEGVAVQDEYLVEIYESTAEQATFDLTDIDTGETYHYDSDTVTPSVAFVIPIAFAAVSLSTALYYLAIGAAVVIAGVLALEAAKAVSKIIEANSKRSNSDKRYYYPAVRSGSKVFISPNGLTYAKAQTRGRTGADVWATSAYYAKRLAKVLNPSGVPIGAEKHGTGYLWHYHPYKHAPNMHSFYGLPS